MQRFIERNETIKVPYVFTRLNFFLRPDHQLDLPHHFFIENIKEREAAYE